MERNQRTYVPAAGRSWALPFYDPLVKLIGGDRARRELLNQAAIGQTDRILDIGCGTGTLVTLIKKLYPDVEAVGLDPDPEALDRGRKKAKQAAVSVRFDLGFSDELPYDDGSFDRVFASFMVHRLREDQREKTFREIKRVLAPGGSLHLLDFEMPETKYPGAGQRWHHTHHFMKEGSENGILVLMRKAGFADSKKVLGRSILFGFLPIGYYQASVSTLAGFPDGGVADSLPVATR